MAAPFVRLIFGEIADAKRGTAHVEIAGIRFLQLTHPGLSRWASLSGVE
jgi:hypothetical protein